MKLWHYFFGQQDARLKNEVLESLKRGGVSTDLLGPHAASGPGVLFFSEMSEALGESLRRLSRDGLQRVLAIAVSPHAVTGGCAWRLLQAGASDVFAWDHSPAPAAEVGARFERWEAVDRLMLSPLVEEDLIGKGPAWTSVLRRVVEVARFTEASILVTGESGTGKEVIARLVHALDPRPHKRQLVILDCTTVVPELSGSEFFGHERGAFTGAVAARDGAFALADQGTLFLDEIGELPPPLQAELLRVVQEHTYKRVGSNNWQRTDFRLVCATNRDLLQPEAQGQFRRDLYYRIATWTCRLPPLRERTTDILPLARYFMKQLRPGESPPGEDEAVRSYLLQRDYPGNVRDLKQVVCRMMYRHVGPGPLTVGDIPEEERPAEGAPSDWRDTAFENAVRRALTQGVGLKEISRASADTAIRLALDEEGGSLQRAARRLAVTDRALQLRRAARRGPEVDPTP